MHLRKKLLVLSDAMDSIESAGQTVARKYAVQEQSLICYGLAMPLMTSKKGKGLKNQSKLGW